MNDLAKLEQEGAALQQRHENGEKVTLDARFAFLTRAVTGLCREVNSLNAVTVSKDEFNELVKRHDTLENPVIRDIAGKVDALEKRRAADDAAELLRKEYAERDERAAEKRADLIKTAIPWAAGAVTTIVLVLVWFFTNYGVPKHP